MNRVLAMARESFRESRGCLPPLIAVGGSLLLAVIGLRLPPPMEAAGPPAAAFFHGGLSLIMSLAAMAYGASAVAADRQSGFSDVLLAKPLTGPVYFLGRYLGLSFRLTLLLAGAVLLGGLLLLFADTKHARVRSADRFSMTTSMDLPVLLQPGGPSVEWVFPGDDLEGKATLRFRFRTRYPKGSELVPSLPLEVTVLRNGSILYHEELEIKSRKSLDIPFPVKEAGDLQVMLHVAGGANYLEVSGNGCKLVYGVSGPVVPLFAAAFSFLPILYLALAVALLFSTFVSVPTSFFACAVLSLLTLAGPSLKAELTSGHPWEVGSSPGTPARVAAKALDLLPDPRDGGGMDALLRVECPSTDDVLEPWEQGLPHLLLVLALGSLLAGRKRG
jgi:hypothetical protein